jgi:hypothetical protein
VLIVDTFSMSILGAFVAVCSTAFKGSFVMLLIELYTHSASMVDSAINGCNLLCHKIGTPPSVSMNPVREHTLRGSLASSMLKIPAKSASTQQSTLKSVVGHMINPLLAVPTKYRPIRFRAAS